MRVTQQTMYNNFLRYLNENREALAEYQQRIVTGKRVTKASDDNIAFTTGRQIQNSIRQNKQYQTNISKGLTKSRFVSDSLNKMIDVLIDFKSLAVRASTESLPAEQRGILADQVEAMKDKLVTLGNTEFNDIYLFGGTKTKTQPFQLDSSAPHGVKYAGNDSALRTKISDISSVKISVTGKDLTTMQGKDLFAILDNMAKALRANNTAKINAGIQSAEKAIDHVVDLASELGVNVSRMEHLKTKLNDHAIDMKQEVSRLIDTNYVKAFSMVQRYKTTYKAALSVHANIIQTSLLDFI